MKQDQEKQIMGRQILHSLAYRDGFHRYLKLSIWAQASKYRNDLKTLEDTLDCIMTVRIKFPSKITTMQNKQLKTSFI